MVPWVMLLHVTGPAEVTNRMPLYVAILSSFVRKKLATVSKTRCFGFKTGSGVLSGSVVSS